MVHPQLERMRPAQRRALHILDTQHGPLTPELPAVHSTAEIHQIELTARTRARQLLDQPMREWLEHLEQTQQATAAEALGLTAPEPREADEVDTDELHLAVSIAELILSAPIEPA
jgi:hypothetical protein